jgi:adenylate cyclase
MHWRREAACSVPLTNAEWWGCFVMIIRLGRNPDPHHARFTGRVGVIPCVGGRGPAAEERLKAALVRGDFRALQVTDDDPGVLAWSGYVLAYFGEDIDAAIKLVDRALALNSSFAQGWYLSGWLRLWAGQPDFAISHFETSLRLSPNAVRAHVFIGIGVCHFFAQRFEDSIAMLLRSLQEHPGWAPTYRFLAACYAHMGRLDEAGETIKRLQAVTRVVMPSAMHWRKPEHRELFLSGLRLAAGEAS